MITETLKLKVYAPCIHSLKETRMVVKSLIGKTRNKFSVLVTEVADQYVHKTPVLGISFVSTDSQQANKITDKLLNFIETSTEREIIAIERGIL